MTPVDLIVMGASFGGLRAVTAILAGISEGFSLPIVIVQHRLAEAEERLVGLLQKHTALKVREAEDKEDIACGNVYLAPTNYHLLIEPGCFALSTEAPVCHARPSIDMLFESAEYSYKDRVLGVVLTGASSDGAKGAASIRRSGGMVIVQAPETAESRVMPEAALHEVPDARVLRLDEIAAFIGTLGASKERKGEDGSAGQHTDY